MAIHYKGIPVSDGIAIGPVLKVEKPDVTPSDYAIQSVQEEKDKYKKALETSEQELQAMIAKVDGEKKEILEAHMSILLDPTLEMSVMEIIDSTQCNIEQALQQTTDGINAQFLAMDDEYMRERAADLQDESMRIMRHLKGVSLVDLSDLSSQVVIIAIDLTPSDTATMDLDNVLGFATDLGGRTSHTAIMARNMGTPAVVGCIDVFANVQPNDIVILDGQSGDIFVNPEEATIQEYKQKQEQFIAHKKRLEDLLSEQAITKDGHPVELACNIGSEKEVQRVLDTQADGVGLFRTEFLYMESTHFPTEEEQYEVYKKVAERLQGKPVIIRTMDIGGDKSLPYFTFPEEMNPFLGYRAVRMCLDKQEIFKVQLRAILRASAFGKIRIMFPFIISLDELQTCKALVKECQGELRAEAIAFDEKIEIGIMVETPASVVLADVFAKHVDFFSIGTNDLTQYTLAVDRGNELIQEMYDPFHPAVLRSIQRVIEASHKEGKWTGMCGEFAGEKKATKLLLGMGLDEFSMSASSILEVKATICESDFSQAQEIAQHVMTLGTAKEIMDYLEQNA